MMVEWSNTKETWEWTLCVRECQINVEGVKHKLGNGGKIKEVQNKFVYLGPNFTSFAILLDPVTKFVILFVFCSLL